MAKRKVKVGRLILVIIFLGLILVGVSFGIYKLVDYFLYNNKPIKKDENKEVIDVETNDDVKLALNDYTVYLDDTNELEYNFVLANITFSSSKPISFDLGNLQTGDTKLNLNDTSKYLNKAELAHYDFSKLNITSNAIVSNENTFKATIFIPYETNADKLSIYNLLDATKIDFDLSINNKAASTLKLQDQNVQIESGETKVSVSNAYVADIMLHNNERIEVGSTIKYNAFELNINEFEKNTKIVSAYFLPKGSSSDIECLSKEYRAQDMPNIIDTDLSTITKGALFFELHSDDDNPTPGTLFIKFSNSDKTYEISTSGE